MLYSNYDDAYKEKLIRQMYINENLSFQDIAKKLGTYTNKIRRDAIKFKIKPRNKSEAQKNAIQTGSHKHPTKGKPRTDIVKNKIGKSIINKWANADSGVKKQKRQKAKELWDNLSEDEKKQRLTLANKAVRETSREGSKLEKYILNKLLLDNHKVDFHKEHSLSNTKLQIDLFLPSINLAIEVDGPSHFLPVWGDDALAKNKKYDNKKSGLIIGKGLFLVRIKQKHDFSPARANIVFDKLKDIIQNKITVFSNSKIIEIED